MPFGHIFAAGKQMGASSSQQNGSVYLMNPTGIYVRKGDIVYYKKPNNESKGKSHSSSFWRKATEIEKEIYKSDEADKIVIDAVIRDSHEKSALALGKWRNPGVFTYNWDYKDGLIGNMLYVFLERQNGVPESTISRIEQKSERNYILDEENTGILNTAVLPEADARKQKLEELIEELVPVFKKS